MHLFFETISLLKYESYSQEEKQKIWNIACELAKFLETTYCNEVQAM